jgi:quercetin dioxygenase-like cupin family protein
MLESKNYEEKIKNLRKERYEVRMQFEVITDNISSIMDNLNCREGNCSMVTVEDFKAVKIGEVIILTSKVSFVKVLEDEKEMHFKTYLKAGGKYGIHSHDCDEHTTVVKGHLIELLNKRRIYNVGETVVYPSKSLHEPACEIDSEYYVVFRK